MYLRFIENSSSLRVKTLIKSCVGFIRRNKEQKLFFSYLTMVGCFSSNIRTEFFHLKLYQNTLVRAHLCWGRKDQNLLTAPLTSIIKSLCTPQYLTAKVPSVAHIEMWSVSSTGIKCDRHQGVSSKSSQTFYLPIYSQCFIWQIYRPSINKLQPKRLELISYKYIYMICLCQLKWLQNIGKSTSFNFIVWFAET